jgi:hypothetical protein
MTDDELVARFESTELPAGGFTHREHVRAAWYYLRRLPLPEAMSAFVAALKRFAAAKGAHGLYHETVTIAWLLLVEERLGSSPDLTWEEFAIRYPELFAKPSLLTRYYTEGALTSERARRRFVMPDRGTMRASHL